MSKNLRERIDFDQLVSLLEEIAGNRGLLGDLSAEERTRLVRAAGLIYNPDTAARRHLVKAIEKKRKAARVSKDDRVLHATGIRVLRRQPVFTTPNVFAPTSFDPADVPPGAPDEFEAEAAARAKAAGSVTESHCYVCKQLFAEVHHFYDQLCPACAAINFAKRTELADLRGRVALLTGGRVKIGYQAGLKLLRAGAHVIVTTRFPRDSAMRYAAEPDFAVWGDRLEVFGLDLRHTPSVEAFCRELNATRPRLDFIINNACQTVRRPPAFYEHMMESENAAAQDMPAHVRKLVGAYEGLRGYHLLPEADAGAAVEVALGGRLSEVAGLDTSHQVVLEGRDWVLLRFTEAGGGPGG